MNKLNKILACFLAFILCFSLFGCGGDVEVLDATQPVTESATQPAETNAPQESSISPALYRVTDENGHTLWLFGSIHVGTEDFYPLPDYVLNAYNSSDALAVEIDIVAMEADLVGQMNLIKMMMYTDGTTIAQHLPAETYEKAVAVLQENQLYNTIMDLYYPAIWWSTIETLAYEKAGALAEYGIDQNLLQMAKAENKEILEVESAELQYSLMAGFSEDLQAMLLQSAVDSYENSAQTAADCQALLDMWSSGDVDAFSAYLQEEDTVEDANQQLLYDEYTEKLITARNATMTEYAENALLSGKEVFLCVGAAHIIGEGAIAENLRQLGYTVELVS